MSCDYTTLRYAKRHTIGAQFAGVQEMTGNNSNPYMQPVCGDSLDPVLRYYDTVIHPHFQTYYKFPRDVEDGPLHSWEWYFDNRRVLPTEYWIPTGEQLQRHPLLPSNENTDQRTTLRSAPLMDGGLRALPKLYYGQYTSWWGIPTNFTSFQFTLPSAITVDSGTSGFWTATNATLAHGAAITVTPTGLNVTVDYDLGKYLTMGGFAEHIFDNIAFSEMGDPGVSAFLVGQDGTEVSLGSPPTDPPSWIFPKPGASTWYIGSYAQNFSALDAVDTEGWDTQASGHSSLYTSDVETAHNPQLSPGYTYAKLRLKWTLSSLAAFDISYPTFGFSNSKWRFKHLNRNLTFVARNDQSGFLYGSWTFWDYLRNIYTDTPMIRYLGTAPTALDLYAWYYLTLVGDRPYSSLPGYFSARWDSVELGDSDVRRALSQETQGFLVTRKSKFFGIYLNSYRAYPPMAGFPNLTRDGDLNFTTTYGQQSWSHAVGPRYHLNSGTKHIHLTDVADGSDKNTKVVNFAKGWMLSFYDGPAPDVSDFWYYYDETTDIARLTPWHGQYVVGDSGGISGGSLVSDGIEILVDTSAKGFLVYRGSDGLYIKRCQGEFPAVGWEYQGPVLLDVTGPPEYHYELPSLTKSKYGTLLLVCMRHNVTSGTFDGVETWSNDEGVTWSTATVVLSNPTWLRIKADPKGGVLRAGFVYDSGTSGPGKIFASYQSAGESSAPAYAAVKDDSNVAISFENIVSDFDYVPSTGTWWLSAVKYGETSHTDFYSSDEGATWKEA